MTMLDPHLRKAAVLFRSMDSDTATTMLAQLSPEEATALRSALRSLGPLDPDEQADVVAALRRERPAKIRSRVDDVELSLSSSFENDKYSDPPGVRSTAGSSNRFEFLESAPTSALVPYLAREHAQTIAVVLSNLAPQRAAAVLAALPQKVQAEAIERLSALGETDPESVSVLERELETWVAKRDGSRAANGRRRDTMSTILAAADPKSRSRILSSLKDRNSALAQQIAPQQQIERSRSASKATMAAPRPMAAKKSIRPATPGIPPLPRVAFDDLVHLDSQTLASVLRQADPNVLALALAGSRDEMVDRICQQMPKRTARAFRRELRRLGPTRLSDVEASQRAVAQAAAQQLAKRQTALSGADL